MSQQRFRAKTLVPERGAVERWDAMTGEIQSIATDGSLALDLAHCESALFVVHVGKRNAAKGASPSAAVQGSLTAWDGGVSARHTHLQLVSTRAHDSNVLVLDYCDVTFCGKTLRRAHHWMANMEIARAHGFDRPVWDNAVQFKRTLLDLDHFGEGTGFEAEFQFEVTTKPARLELALECPDLYRVAVNGTPISFRSAPRWLDPHIRSADITRSVRPGRNRVMLDARPFRIRMELEPIYLRGEFGLEPTQSGFRIGPPRPLALGSWRKQGRPFYGDAVSYEFRCRMAATQGRQVLRLPDWAGSVVAVNVNGQKAGIIAWPRALTVQGGYELDVTRWLREGANRLRLTVYGTPKNLIGPFHCKSQAGPGGKTESPRRTAWPSMWSGSPKAGPPPGDRYDQIDYGLFAAPEIHEA